MALFQALVLLMEHKIPGICGYEVQTLVDGQWRTNTYLKLEVLMVMNSKFMALKDEVLCSLGWYIPVFWRNHLPMFSGYMNAQFLVLVYQTVWCYPCRTYAKWAVQFNSHPDIHHSELKIVVWFDFATGSFWWSVFLLKEWTRWLSALQRFGCEVLLVPVEANGWNQCNAGSMTMMWEPLLWQMGNSSPQVGVQYIVFRTFKFVSGRLFWSWTAEYM